MSKKSNSRNKSKKRRFLWSDFGLMSPATRVVPNKKKVMNKQKCRKKVSFDTTDVHSFEAADTDYTRDGKRTLSNEDMLCF